jgi:predicted RNA methylase
MSKNGNKKFDVCLMNPPFDRNLHLKILEKAIQVSDYTVNISPVRWLQDPLGQYKDKSDFNKFENSISKHIKDLEIIENNHSQNNKK